MKLSNALLGGHGSHEPFEVPHYSKYNNYKQSPELAEHEKRLARLGLKDPWIRNIACNFEANVYKPGVFIQMWNVS